ncbi:MAG: PAS domain-containing protein [Magnetococcales bacterium]|nr:PAS domain-containing protein [Magnetococcales bacterium]
MRIIYLILISFLIITPNISNASTTHSAKHILLLNSYHATMPWVRNVVQSVIDTLKPMENKINLHAEFMDTKRIPYTLAYKTSIKTMLKAKYQNKGLNLILVSDNNAFDFMREFGEEIFPGVPVVFCGVNNFQDAWLKNLQNFTGLAEIFDARSTLSTALKINPNIRQIYILNDYLPTGKAWSQTIKDQISGLKNNVEIKYLQDMPFSELLNKVSKLKPDSIIIMGVYFRDSLGKYYEPWQSAKQLSQRSSVPIYGLLDLYLNHGIIGGKLISGYHQGQGAAQIALRILSGEDPAKIQVKKTGVNQLIFDHKLLKRFNISFEKLPAGSKIINRPETFLNKYAKYVWGAAIVFITLFTMVVVLLLNISKRRQVENSLRISEERFSLAMQGINDGLWDWNLKTDEIYFSPGWKTMLGYEDDELENHLNVWKANLHPDDLDKAYQTIDDYLAGKLDRYEIEHNMRHKKGHYLSVLSRGLAVRDKNGKPIRFIGTHIDITEHKLMEKKIKLERKRVELLLEAIPVWVFVLAPDYSIKWFNKHFIKQFGDPTGKPCYSIIQGKDKPCEVCPTFEVFETKTMATWEFFDPLSGRTSIVYDSFFIDSDGSPLVLEMGIDITERKTAEEDLDRFFTISSDLFVVIATDGTFFKVNSSWEKVLGWTEQELLNKPFIDFVHPEDREKSNLEVEKQLNTKKPTILFFNRYITKEGLYKWLEWTAVPGPDGKLYGVGRDVTQRLQAEKSLKESKKQLEIAQKIAHIGYWRYDVKSAKQTWTDEMFSIFGCDPEQDIPNYEKHKEIIHPDDWEMFDKAIQACALGTSYNLVIRIIYKDSSIHYVNTHGYPNIADDGTITELFGICQDITEQRNTEKLRRAKEIAEKANKTKSQFLASISHDIRTPMNAILGMGEMLAESNVNEEQKHYIDIINNSGNGLLALINDILDLSKIEAGQLKLESIPFNPKDLVKYSVDTLKANALNQGIGMTVNVDSLIPDQVIGDPTRLQQILLNLLSNAVKFTSRGKVVLSLVKTEKEMMQFSVADTGIGIPKNKQKTIFQPFEQAESSTTRRFGGTGLGLSICEKLVSKMGGNIWVESKLKKGSTFYFEIPCHEAKTEEPQISQGIKSHIEQEKPTTGFTILLADDVEENCMVISAFLKNSPHHLTVVENGSMALDEYKNGNFDLILMDIHMPIMDGYMATKEIRKWERKQNITPVPILALTANAMKEDIEKTRQVGCNLHLSKPIRKQLLLDTIKQFT